ncbi:hypothetical protein [Luteitalea sp.]
MITRHGTRAPWWARLAIASTFLVFLGTATVHGDSWNDRTTLRFSAPVLIPGATLQPGEYVFRLMDLKSSRHMVQVLTADESRVIATTHAIPVKRRDPEGTTTLTFNATAEGAPPALKAWYYPGSIYGHEFVYPEAEARQIASRNKTIVLSDDAASGDAAKGSLRLYNADGTHAPWSADDAVIREWTVWSDGVAARARTASDAGDEAARRATAPIVDSTGGAMRVAVGDLEEHATKYTGKTISVDAEVEKVLGPRLFTIDEPSWADLDGEVLVYMPSSLATLVRADDLVTITGSMQPFVQAEVEREWKWFAGEPEINAQLSRRPVLVASRISGGDDDRALFISKGTATSSPARSDAVSSVREITPTAVGKTVDLKQVEVGRVVAGRGFFVVAGPQTVFVRPANGEVPQVKAGQTVSLEGIVLTLPPGARDEIKRERAGRADVYVYATEIS